MKPSINADQFRKRSPYVQQMLVKKYGVLLFAKSDSVVSAWLYQLGNFYLEVIFDEREMKLLHTNCFEDVQGLNTYLDELDISDVLKLF